MSGQARPSTSQYTPASVTTFSIVYFDEITNPSFDIPFNEPFDTFLSRLGQVQRTAMRYSLVDCQGRQEDMRRLLSGNLFYQAMISELVKRPGTWDHAVVWQERLDEYPELAMS